MSKYDDFDLDVKNIQSSGGDGVSPQEATGGLVCFTITLSLDICGTLSEIQDCASENHDCSETHSACGACTVSSMRMARRC